MDITLSRKTSAMYGGSFHGTMIDASVNELTQVLGAENIGASGDGKTIHEWFIKAGDKYFSIYDWKEYRNYPDDEQITWHIGSKYTPEEERKVADEIEKRINEIRNQG